MSKKKDTKLILLEKLKAAKELTERETELKEKLQEIEDNLLSAQKVVDEIYKKNPHTIYNCHSFNVFVNSIALTQAMTVITEYFGVDVSSLNDLLED